MKLSYERYLVLARAEAQNGNAVAAENYYQRAEHYFRSMHSGSNENSAAARNFPGLIRILILVLGKAEENVLGTILIIILILLLIGALPTWGYSSGWGYYPGGGLGIILIIVIILVLMGRI